MKTLLVCSHDPANAVSFYRTYCPLNHLREQLDFTILPWDGRVLWDQVGQCDAIWIERPTQHAELITLARNMGKPVIVDMDDDLLSVPTSNGLYAIYSRESLVSEIRDCLRLANKVIVSTPHLQSRMRDLGVASDVVPNAYAESLFPYAVPRDTVAKTIVWRGTHTHAGDVIPVRSQLLQVMSEHPDWRFIFWGDCPFMDLPKNASHLPPTGVLTYHRMLWDLNPAFVIVPLEDNAFNKSKSNGAWLEATHAGAVCIAPNWPEWQRPGVRPIVASLYGEIDAAIRDFESPDGEARHATRWGSSAQFIASNLTLSHANEKRAAILESLW